jgi:hypothetical protein
VQSVEGWKIRTLEENYLRAELFRIRLSKDPSERRRICAVLGVKENSEEDVLGLWIQNPGDPLEKGFKEIVSRGARTIQTFINPKNDEKLSSLVTKYFETAEISDERIDIRLQPRAIRLKNHIKRFVSSVNVLDKEDDIINVIAMLVLEIYDIYSW